MITILALMYDKGRKIPDPVKSVNGTGSHRWYELHLTCYTSPQMHGQDMQVRIDTPQFIGALRYGHKEIELDLPDESARAEINSCVTDYAQTLVSQYGGQILPSREVGTICKIFFENGNRLNGRRLAQDLEFIID